MSCPSGKRRFTTYGAGLAALEDLDARGRLRGPFGSVYQCSRCEGFHISSRRFTLVRRKGRGKARRGLLEDVG
jgi:hypothetical protein